MFVIRAVLSSLALLVTVTTLATAQDASRWFLAEGASNAVLEQEILVANPGASNLTVTVRLLPDPSAQFDPTKLVETFALAPTARLTVRMGQAFPHLNGAASAEVSAVVAGTTTPADIVVERSMYFPDGTRAGAHNASGVTELAQRWILAEGASGIFNTFILVANPNASATTVRVQYLKNTGEVVEFTESVAARSRRTFWPQIDSPAALGAAEFSTVVESLDAGKPIVAERAMYFDPSPSGSGFQRSGHDALGVPQASTTWYFAEGFTGGNAQIAFETFLLLANTNDVAVTATVTYQLDSGAAVSRDYVLPPNQRFTVWVDQEGRTFDPRLEASAFGMTVSATAPVVAERAMYWGTPSVQDPATPALPWREGHATAGSTALASRWAFAEGRQGIDAAARPYDTFFLLSNPSASPVTVRATFVTEDGGGFSTTTTIPAKGRTNIWPNPAIQVGGTFPFAPLANRRFATFIESTGGGSFIAERAMYVYGDYSSGHVNMGTPWSAAFAVPATTPTPVQAGGFTPNTMRLTGGEAITITGTGFSGVPEVTIDGIPAAIVSTSPTQIVATAPSRTAATGFGPVAPSTVRLTTAGTTLSLGTINRVFRVLAIGDSFTEGMLVERVPPVPPATTPTQFYSDAAPPYPDSLEMWLRGDGRFRSTADVRNEGYSGECAALRGCSGNITSGASRIADLVAGRTFDAVIIMEGFNDLNAGGNVGSAVDALRFMAQTARASGATPILGILDGPMNPLSGSIQSMATAEGFHRHNFRNIELGTDDIHPTQEGYDDMGRQMYEKLKAIFMP